MVRASWPPRGLLQLESSLDSLAEAVRTPGRRSDDEQMWLTRFLVVRACGYLEQVVHLCAVAHIEARSGGTAKLFALSWLSRSQNPSHENLLNLIRRFDGDMRNELCELMEDNSGEIKRELSTLVTQRHKIAHGLNEGLGARRALELVDTAKYVADWIVHSLNPNSDGRNPRIRARGVVGSR
jgi:hypothetical protein